MNEETYIVYRLPEWSDNVWDQIVDAIEETVVAVATDLEDQE